MRRVGSGKDATEDAHGGEERQARAVTRPYQSGKRGAHKWPNGAVGRGANAASARAAAMKLPRPHGAAAGEKLPSASGASVLDFSTSKQSSVAGMSEDGGSGLKFLNVYSNSSCVDSNAPHKKKY